MRYTVRQFLNEIVQGAVAAGVLTWSYLVFVSRDVATVASAFSALCGAVVALLAVYSAIRKVRSKD